MLKRVTAGPPQASFWDSWFNLWDVSRQFGALFLVPLQVSESVAHAMRRSARMSQIEVEWNGNVATIKRLAEVAHTTRQDVAEVIVLRTTFHTH